ncbi:hypothetical protein MMEU_2172 [Mycobacterium marinum str. Europe]|nr:hypothetical protein MMEU_2172 [Mycobacterium marinum str. Europe]
MGPLRGSRKLGPLIIEHRRGQSGGTFVTLTGGKRETAPAGLPGSPPVGAR